MIRFAVVASVVSAAVALLVIGALSGDLSLVYVSIGLAAFALLMLIVGVAVWRDRVFAAAKPVQAGPLQAGPVQAARPTSPAPADDRRARPPAEDRRERRRAREHVADRAAEWERPEPEQYGRPPEFGGSRPATAEWAGHATAYAERPGRESPPAGRAPRRPETAEPRPPERAVAAERAARGPEGAEPYPPAEQPEPADDPTRLAHRLGIGRQARPAAASQIRQPEARAAATTPAPPASPPAAAAQPETPAEPAVAGPSPASSRAPSSAPPRATTAAATSPATAGREAGDVAPADRETDEAAPADGAAAAATRGAPAGTDASAPKAAENAPATASPATGAASPEAAVTADAASQADAGGDGGVPAADPDTPVLVVPGIARYHKAECILIRFLSEDDLQKMSRQEAEAAGSAACRACRP